MAERDGRNPPLTCDSERLLREVVGVTHLDQVRCEACKLIAEGAHPQRQAVAPAQRDGGARKAHDVVGKPVVARSGHECGVSHPRVLRQPIVLRKQVASNTAAGRREEQRHVHEVPLGGSSPQRNDALRQVYSQGAGVWHELRLSGRDVTISLRQTGN